MAGLNEEKNEIKNLNYLDMKEKKDKDIRDLLQKTSEQGGEGFYHNPDSINLTLKQNQMKSMFININRAQNNTNNNIYGNNIEENNYDINKKEKDKDRDRDKKNKDKEDKKEEKETGILSLEQFNKELD